MESEFGAFQAIPVGLGTDLAEFLELFFNERGYENVSLPKPVFLEIAARIEKLSKEVVQAGGQWG